MNGSAQRGSESGKSRPCLFDRVSVYFGTKLLSEGVVRVATKGRRDTFGQIALENIDPPAERVRMDIPEDAIEELAQSIAERGLLQPIVIRPRDGRFEIVAGERRFMAMRKLGRKTITAKVVDVDDEGAAVDRATENLQRAELTPVEEGCIYANLRDSLNLSIEKIARKLGKSAGRVSRRLHLLDMPPEIQKAVHSGKISVGVAEELMGCADDARRSYFLEMAVEHGVTVAIMRSWVHDWRRSEAESRGDVGGGGGGAVSLNPLPSYGACQICEEPEEYQYMEHLMVCRRCSARIRNAIREAGAKEGG